jgi:hypothetical protein
MLIIYLSGFEINFKFVRIFDQIVKIVKILFQALKELS